MHYPFILQLTHMFLFHFRIFIFTSVVCILVVVVVVVVVVVLFLCFVLFLFFCFTIMSVFLTLNVPFRTQYALQYEATTDMTAITAFGFNDVEPMDAHSFYITRSLPFTEPGPGIDTGILNLLKVKAYMTNPFNLKWTKIYYCEGPGAGREVCRPVGTNASEFFYCLLLLLLVVC